MPIQPLLRRSLGALRGAALAALLAGPTLSFLACEPEAPILPGSVPQSSRLAISADGATLYIAMADHDEVRAVDASTGETRHTVAVPGQPHRLTLLDDGRVAVTSRLMGTVSIVRVEAERVDAVVDVGSDPHEVVQVGDELIVAVSGEGDLARVSIAEGRLTGRVALVADDPRGLAVDGATLLVSHFTAGRLSTVDLEAGVAVGDIDMRLPSRPFFAPNQMEQMTVHPSRPGEVAVPHVECNNDPAQFGAGNDSFAGVAAAEYYNQGPTGFPAVVPAISRADTISEILISDDRAPADPFSVGLTVELPGPANPLINPNDRTLLEDVLVNGPVAVALADDGRLELVVALASGNVVVRRTELVEGQDSIIGTVDVGVGADSIVLSPDGTRAWVFNPFAQSLTRFEVPLDRRAISRFNSTDKGGARAGVRDEPLKRFSRKTWSVAPQVLPADVVEGRTLFHSVGPELSRSGAIACASCHPGGGDDGTTWTFAEGPRQSPPLWGGIMGTEPFHWDQAVRTIEDISSITIIGRMGGTGLGGASMRAIGAYLDTIPAPAPRATASVDGESVIRGARLFNDETVGCTSCHRGADLTDGFAHDVGTGPGAVARETMTVFATPPLKGLAHSAPYMHDGSAATLRDVVIRYVRTDKMGTGSHLSDADVVDLVAFLEQL